MSQTLKTMLVEGGPILDYLIDHPEEIGVLEEAIEFQEDQLRYLWDRDPDPESMEQEKVEQWVLDNLLQIREEWGRMWGS